MRLAWLSVLFALVWLCVPAWPQSAKKSSSANRGAAPAKKAATPTSKKSAAASRAGQSRSAQAKSSTARRRARATGRPIHRVSQQAPSRERYVDIQKALTERGYYQGEPDGNWGESSIEALKKFQEDQNLKPDGKLNSLSLIALGLGPRHTAAAYPPKSPGDAASASGSQPASPLPSETGTPAASPSQPVNPSPLAQPLQ
jgi:peptidoglycan hydrolase-like protein with peptidoglycan-binding domain